MLHISTISPVGLAHMGLAVATCRAGGTGVLDFTWEGDCGDSKLRRKFLEFVQSVSENSIGIRLRGSQLASSGAILDILADRPHWLVLEDWKGVDWSLAAAPLREVILEISDASQLSQLSDLPTQAGLVAGLIARGNECGGWVGSQQSFVLLRKLLAQTDLPIHVQGGIGPQTAAACHLAGAAGVVLADQLWLMPESPLRSDWKTQLANLNGSETLVVGESIGKPLRFLHRAGFAGAEKLRLLDVSAPDWAEQASALLGWKSPEISAWPIGQSVGLAGLFTQTHSTTGRLIQAIFEAVEKSAALALEFPLPTLCSPEPAPNSGIPVEENNTATFLPIPTGTILETHRARGDRYFVFSGGTKAGLLSNFNLWETAVQILQKIPKTQGREYNLRFTGGIDDPKAYAMIAALTAPLAAMSMKISVETAAEHENLRTEGRALLEAIQPPVEIEEVSAPCDIAIVGMSVLFPKAHDPETFWTNIVRKLNVISEIPPERWDWRLYYDADRTARDKINSKWGSFIDEVEFDPLYFGMPPNILKSIEPLQFLALEATRRALADAGYEKGGFDKERASVILGLTGGQSDLGMQFAARGEAPRMFKNLQPDDFDRLAEWTDEAFPGIIPNVTAGRVANRFGFGGSNFTVDAACASSLAAIDLAIQELSNGRCDLAVSGGVDTLMSPSAYFCFSKVHALSSTGKLNAFDEDSDGIVLGEGGGILILKRLADAERDGDKIHAVIKAMGNSSDGRSASMTAPVSEGQMRAFRRAYDKAGFPFSSVGLYEAHGTGTPVGDRIELNSAVKYLGKNGGVAKSCAAGSVKSLIGHTKSAAGVAGVIKSVMALQNKVLPPHYGVDKPLKRLRDPKSPLYLLKEAVPWVASGDSPRRASVSAFGFGGTNFHAVLEEYQGSLRSSAQGGEIWPSELFLWQLADQATLEKKLTDFRAAVALSPTTPLRDWACSLSRQLVPDWKVSLGIVASSVEELLAELDKAMGELQAPGSARPGINTILQVRETIPTESPKVAFLFPGQGSQYTGMGRETALYFPEMLGALEEGDAAFTGQFGRNLSQFIFPPATFSPEEQKDAEKQLSATQIAQPGIGVLSCGYLDLLRHLGVEADFHAGHSYGEYTALHAAGVLSRPAFLHLSGVRGKVMASACDGEPGAMAAVKAPREEIVRLIQDDRIVVANHNAPRQTVISGPTEAILQAIARLEEAKVSVRQLPVAGAFHSPLMQFAQGPLSEAISAADVSSPKTPVYSNTHAQPYENDPDAIKARLSGHMLSSVEFVAEIDAIYEAGARLFIEVGPRTVLTGLAREILQNHPDITAVALDSDRGNLRGLLRSLAQLTAAGLKIDWQALYETRNCHVVGLVPQAVRPQNALHEGAKILVSGGSIRKPGEPRGMTGIKPHLNLDTLTSTEARILPDPPRSEQKANIMSANEHLVEPPPAATTDLTPLPAESAIEAYRTYQETMRQFLQMQEQVMTAFLSGETSSTLPAAARPAPAPRPAVATVARVAAPAPVAKAPTPAVEVPKTNGHAPTNGNGHEKANGNGNGNANGAKHEGPMTREALTAELLRLVSERTGYPTEVLGLEQDMESELGIDSIKRVEIFGALQGQLPASLTSRIPEGGEDFTRVRTLQGWVDALMSLPA